MPKDDPDKLAERVAILETDMKWIKKKLDTIDKRTWYTLGSVVVFGIISVIIALIGLMPK
jgi:tetrahydromethanopterin S-methyltransferase subunit G